MADAAAILDYTHGARARPEPILTHMYAAAAASAAGDGATAVKSSAPVNYVIMPGNLHLAARHYILHAFCLPTGIQLDIPNMAAQWTI